MFLAHFLFALLGFLATEAIHKSKISISSVGMEFQPKYAFQLLATTTGRTLITCSAACNQLPACRSFDFDSVSKRCRLFEGDATTGSVVSSSSSTSVVGSVVISSVLFSSIHNQACGACVEDRYETCAGNSSVCQCPSHAYWDGSVCALQLFANSTCPQGDACRSDLNLTCAQECYGQFTQCVIIPTNYTAPSSMGYGATAAGTCNSSSTTNQTVLSVQAGIRVDYNNRLYVADGTNRLLVFDQNNRTTRVLRSFISWPTYLFYENRTSWIYITLMDAHLVHIWPTNKTIPPSGIINLSCSMSWLWSPTGIAVDSVGNVYISSYQCNWITKWAPNATSGILVAGSATGTFGSDSLSLSRPYNLALDEANSFIYVADRFNYRIQRFPLSGSGVGVTVAGGYGQGRAANQLDSPTDLYLSRWNNTLYIADSANNRVQKWNINGTTGTTIAGSPNGTVGSSPYLISNAYSITVDYDETYLYVSDSNNNRIQRFSLR